MNLKTATVAEKERDYFESVEWILDNLATVNIPQFVEL